MFFWYLWLCSRFLLAYVYLLYISWKALVQTFEKCNTNTNTNSNVVFFILQLSLISLLLLLLLLLLLIIIVVVTDMYHQTDAQADGQSDK